MAPRIPGVVSYDAVHARFPIAFLLALAAVRAPYAQGAATADGHLDTAAVRDAYLRSDIPAVRASLEGFIKNHPQGVRREEKVFTHLYLGAAYAGLPGGRDRSEAHFRAALRLDPSVDAAPLYLPPAAQAWFEFLRADLRAAPPGTPAAGPGLAAAPVPGPRPDTTAAQAGRQSPNPPADPAWDAAPRRAWLWWALGGAAAAAAGTYAWAVTRDGTGPHRVQVDATLK